MDKPVFVVKNKFDIIDYSDSQPDYTRDFPEHSVGFKTKNSYYFKNIISFIASVVDQVNLKFCDEGVRFTSMDSSHVALINGFIPTNFFNCYNIGNKQHVYGVNIKVLMKILASIKKDDELIFKLDSESNQDSIDISIISSKCKKYYSMKLIDIIEDELQITEIPGTCDINFDSKYFNSIISEFNEIGEVIKIKISESSEEISFSCEGEMTDLMLVVNNEDIEYENIQDIEICYSLKNFQTFIKGHNISKSLKMEICEENPIKMSYKLMDTGYIDYYLAPRMYDE